MCKISIFMRCVPCFKLVKLDVDFFAGHTKHDLPVASGTFFPLGVQPPESNISTSGLMTDRKLASFQNKSDRLADRLSLAFYAFWGAVSSDDRLQGSDTPCPFVCSGQLMI